VTGRPRSRRDDAPRPPWGSFPLVELCALSAIVLGIWGLLSRNGALMAGAALLGSVAGLEVAVREHLGGYRSHTLVLAGTLTVVTLVVLTFAGVDHTLLLVIGLAILVAAFLTLRQLFKRRSGGVAVRVR